MAFQVSEHLFYMNKFITSFVSAAALAAPLLVSAQAVAPANMPVAPAPQVAPTVQAPQAPQAPQAAPAVTYKAEPYVAPKADKKSKKKKSKKALKAKKAKKAKIH